MKNAYDLLAFQAAAIQAGCDPITVIVWTCNGYLNQRRDPPQAWLRFEESFKRTVKNNQNNVNNWGSDPDAERVENYKEMLKELLGQLEDL